MQAAINSSLPMLTHTARGLALCTTGSVCSGEDGSSVTVIGSPYWLDLQFETQARKHSHAQALASAYQRDGMDCLKLIRGAFSFIIADGENKALFAGIDRMGQFPLYYTKTGTGIALGSTAGSVLAHGGVKASLTSQGVYSYMYFHMIPSPTSIYDALGKLPAAHYLKFDDNELSIHSYWQPSYKRNPPADFERLRENFRRALQDSISRATGDVASTASFLSGGLDSSTVTGMLAELHPGSTEAYSIGFDAEGYDEMPYARIAARHFGVKLNEHYVTPDDVVDSLPLIATSYDEPFGNSSALPAWFCAKFAADNGVARLLAGDGGDELFAGNERYGLQRVFDIYGHVPLALRKGLIEPLARVLPSGLPLISKARGYIEQANTPLPARLQHYNFLHRHDVSSIFSDDILAEVDTRLPLQLQQAVFDLPSGASTLDRMLFLDWQYTLADNDIRKVSHTAALAGVEIAYPLLDDALVEMSCSIPDSLKLKGKNLRYFFKEALRGWLPQETIDKKKHGFGLPFGVWMRTHSRLQQIAYDSLIQLKDRKLFKPEFIDSTIERHRSDHASYYGELIWVLMTLELWMQREN